MRKGILEGVTNLDSTNTSVLRLAAGAVSRLSRSAFRPTRCAYVNNLLSGHIVSLKSMPQKNIRWKDQVPVSAFYS